MTQHERSTKKQKHNAQEKRRYRLGYTSAIQAPIHPPLAASFVISALLLTPAYAADAQVWDDAAPPQETFDERRFGGVRGKLHDWKVTIGGGAIYMPEYEGSDKFEVAPVPLFSAQFGERVHLDPGGLTVDIFSTNGFKFSATGGIDMGRQEDDSDYLRGLGDIDMGGVVGGVVSYETGPFEFYAGLDKTIGGSDGLTGTFGAKASHQYEQFLFSADVSGTWADDKHMESYFGITSAQAARSGLPAYEAKAGIKRVDFKASVTYMINDNWSVTGAAGAGLLLGDAKDSPIVKDDVQPFGMLAIGYRF